MCSPILCIYIIVIIILLIYMWDFNSIMYVYMTHFSYNTRRIYFLCLFLSRTLTTKHFLNIHTLKNIGFWTCKIAILVWHYTLKKPRGATNILSFNKVFNSLSLCFVYLVLQTILDVYLYIYLQGFILSEVPVRVIVFNATFNNFSFIS